MVATHTIVVIGGDVDSSASSSGVSSLSFKLSLSLLLFDSRDTDDHETEEGTNTAPHDDFPSSHVVHAATSGAGIIS